MAREILWTLCFGCVTNASAEKCCSTQRRPWRFIRICKHLSSLTLSLAFICSKRENPLQTGLGREEVLTPPFFGREQCLCSVHTSCSSTLFFSLSAESFVPACLPALLCTDHVYDVACYGEIHTRLFIVLYMYKLFKATCRGSCPKFMHEVIGRSDRSLIKIATVYSVTYYIT